MYKGIREPGEKSWKGEQGGKGSKKTG